MACGVEGGANHAHMVIISLYILLLFFVGCSSPNLDIAHPLPNETAIDESSTPHDGDSSIFDTKSSEALCKPSTAPLTNVALNKPSQADQSRSATENASKANDGLSTTCWSASDGVPGHWWKVDLGKSIFLNRMTTTWQYGGTKYLYDIEVSNDDIVYTKVDMDFDPSINSATRKDTFPTGVCARYVRLTKTDSTGFWAILYEVEIYGRP